MACRTGIGHPKSTLDIDGEASLTITICRHRPICLQVDVCQGGRAVSVRVTAMIRADGRAMLSWWSSTLSPKWILDGQVYRWWWAQCGQFYCGSVNASSPCNILCCLAPTGLSWALNFGPYASSWDASSWDFLDRLADCAMGVFWRLLRTFYLSLVFKSWACISILAAGCLYSEFKIDFFTCIQKFNMFNFRIRL